MASRRARLAGALLVILTSALAATTAAGASQAASPPPAHFGIRLLQVPVSEANDPRARLYIIDRLAPGTTVHRKFQVSNEGSKPVTLSVYPAAASIAKGVFQFAAGHAQNEMTTWIKIDHGTVALGPQAKATLTATIAVPRDAPPGEQYGVIWAQQGAKGAGNVTLVNRVGIRLYLSIGPGGAPAPDFTLGAPVTSRAPGGSPLIHVSVRNTGGRALDIRGTVQLAGGPGGLQAGPFNAAGGTTVAPGQSAQEVFSLSSSLPSGPWQASFKMVSGLITKTEKATLSFNGRAAPTPTAARKSFPIVPVAAGGAVLVLLLAAAFFIARSRRSDRARHA